MTTTTTTAATARGKAALRPLLELAEPVVWVDRQYVVLDSPEQWLVVESGQVDLFAVVLRFGRPHGPWKALCRLSSGDIVTGSLAGPRHRILCRRVEDAQARLVSLTALKRLVGAAVEAGGPHGPVVSCFSAGVESGVHRLGGTSRDGLPPRDFTALSSSNDVDLARDEAARTIDAILWVSVLSGEIRDGGSGDAVRGPGEQLCLTRQDWLVARTEARISTAVTSDVVRDGSIWSRLVTHCTRLLHAVDRAVETGDRARLDQLAVASERDALVLDQLRQDHDKFVLGLHAPSGTPVGGLAARGHLAAVVTVLDHLGVPYQPPPPDLFGTQAADYEAIGDREWVRTRAVRLDRTWWRTSMGALVGYWGVDHLPAAFLPTEGGYLVQAVGLDEPVRATAANQHLAGQQAFAVYPMLPADVTSVWALLRHGFTGLRRVCLLFLAMALLVGAASLLTPILSGRILGTYVESANRSMIVQGGLIVILSGLVAGAFSVVQNLAVLRIQGAVTASTQTALWSRLLQLPVTFFARYSTGRLGTIILGVKAAQEILSGVVVAAALGLVIALANLVLLFFYSFSLACLGLALALLALLICFLAGRRQLRFERDRYEQDQKLSAMTYETLSAITKIRGTAGEERSLLRWAAQQQVVQARVMRGRRMQDAVLVVNAVYPLLSLGLLYVVASRIGQAALPLTDLLSFLTAFLLMLTALLQFTGSALSAVPIIPMLESLGPVLLSEPESGAAKALPGDLAGRISMRQISFRYGDDGPVVLDGIDLDIAPGEFVALVGPSGSGKSTVIRLILGFDKPMTGSVLFDGQDLGALDLHAVRRQCGVVLQNGALMPGDVRDNIAAGGRYKDDEIWEAAEMAGLAADIRAMPMKLNSVVDDSAHTFSGGQAQRLMLARALISRPRIVIFDEATSALDNPTQQVVVSATKHLNATRIVVAHRLSTVQSADRIVVLDRGKIVQQGRYEQLIADQDGVFAALARGQRA
ncbi:MAG TPA: ATP-binding cassette domain-containing protein [Mycobacteriales bacterium]|jgi:NHLM bacteriocin system ABC transporter ATP-binding protein|nr:ATP-binding cassette domain-containing protein [Mycobacteriales bacterium]